MENIMIPNGIIKGIISGKKKKDNKYEKGKIQRININGNDEFRFLFLLISRYFIQIIMMMK